MKLHLWQLGYAESSFVRGATNAYNVFKCLEKDLIQGGQTEKYPIEVVPFMQGEQPGTPILNHSIVTSIGASVVTSAYLICIRVMDKRYFNVQLDYEGASMGLQALASRCLCLAHLCCLRAHHRHEGRSLQVEQGEDRGKLAIPPHDPPLQLCVLTGCRRSVEQEIGRLQT